MAMFNFNESKLRAAFDDSQELDDHARRGWVAPFDPISVDADELHRIVEDCLLQDIIERADPKTMIAVYPQAIIDPEPLLAVNPEGGPMLLGGLAIHHVSEDRVSTAEERSVLALAALVEDANALYAESEPGKTRSKSCPCESRCCREVDE